MLSLTLIHQTYLIIYKVARKCVAYLYIKEEYFLKSKGEDVRWLTSVGRMIPVASLVARVASKHLAPPTPTSQEHYVSH